MRSGLATAGSDQNPALPGRWYRAHWTYLVIQEIYDEIKRSYGQEGRQSLAPLGDAALDHEARMRPEAPQQAPPRR